MPVRVRFWPDHTVPGTYVDVSDYLLLDGISPLRRWIESDQIKQPGIMMLDSVNLEFPYDALSTYFSSSALQSAITSSHRYIFQIAYTIGASTYVLFDGMVDFWSIEYTAADTVRFKVVDRLTALTLIQATPVRVAATLAASSGYRWEIYGGSGTYTVYLAKYDINAAQYVDFSSGDCLPAGATFKDDTGLLYYFVTKSQYVQRDIGTQEDIYVNELTLHNPLTAGYTLTTLYYWEEEIYYEDMHITSSGVIIAFDALDLAKAIIKKAWPDVSFYTDLSFSTYQLSLDNFENMGVGDYEEDIMGQHPLEALRWLAKMMRIYIYFNNSQECCLVEFPDTTPVIYLEPDADYIMNKSIKFAWDKKVDGVKVNAQSGDGSITEHFYPPYGLDENRDELFEVDIFKPLAEDPDDIAEALYSFYGYRHQGAKITIPCSSAAFVFMELLMHIKLDSVMYFIVGIMIDLKAYTLELDLVSIDTWDMRVGD